MFNVRSIIKSIFLAAFFTLSGLVLGYTLFAPEDGIFLKPEGSQITSISNATSAKGKFGTAKGGLHRIIEGRTVFSLCGHSEPLNLGSFQGASEEFLLENFPADQGWTIEDTGEKLVLTKKINALCPADDAKRHLGHFGDYIAVIKGPVGVDGGILEVTDIPLSSLPKHVREQAKKGTLAFSDVQSLLEALDSMDEFED